MEEARAYARLTLAIPSVTSASTHPQIPDNKHKKGMCGPQRVPFGFKDTKMTNIWPLLSKHSLKRDGVF